MLYSFTFNKFLVLNPSPSCAEVKNAWSYIFTPQYICMAWCLIKQETRLYEVVLN